MPSLNRGELTEQTINNMDMFVFRMLPEAEQDRITAYAAGRNCATVVFQHIAIPDDLLEAARIVRESVYASATSHDVDTEEFTLGTVLTAFALRRMPQ